MTKKYRLALFILLISTLMISVIPASSDYSFEVPKAEVIFWVATDGTVSISYQYTFNNKGQGLDYIDIGMPNDDFRPADVQATINGKEVKNSKISRASYSETGLVSGITIDNTSSPIPSGSSADVYVYVPRVGSMLYKSDKTVEENKPYVGFEFQPNFFNNDFVHGSTDYTLRLVLPVGMVETEPYYYQPSGWPGTEKPEAYFTDNKNVGYEWHYENASASDKYRFGAMFPQAVLSSENEVNESNEYNSGSSSNGTDDTFEDIIFGLICLVLPFALIALGIYRIIKERKNRNSYLPPKIRTSGGGAGIKRGLTAVEAAVLLEKDLDRVISMIMFSLTKKGVVTITSKNPMKFEIQEEVPEDLYEYEKDYLKALEEDNSSERTQLMKDTIHRLILSVTQKMKGFDVKDTKAYYEGICEKAWTQVEKAGTPDLRGELLDKNFGWAMLDEEPEKKIETAFGGSTVYAPSWWWRMDPTYHSMGQWSQPTIASPVSTSASGSGSVKATGAGNSTPVLPGSDFARSVTNSMRGVGEATVGSIMAFTRSVRGITNPAPAPSTSSNRHSGSGRGSGGSSCACACACASCACACAGGGR